MNKLKLLTILVIFTFAFSSSWAAGVSAEGYGKTEPEARANAAAELSFILFSDVRSELHTLMSDDPANPQQSVSKQVDITSALPIFGADYTTEEIQGEFHCKVTMSAEKAVVVYAASADDAAAKINRLYGEVVKKSSDSQKYPLVMTILAEYENFNKYKGVINVLGGEYKNYPNVTMAQIFELREKLANSSDDMRHIASLIVSELSKPNTYIYYPMYRGSDEVTEFASVFRDMMVTAEKTSANIADADYLLETDYLITDNYMYITSTLNDKNGKAVGKSVKKLASSAYAGLKIKPESISFEKLLKLGLAVTSDFTARLMTDNGKKAMLYKKGESIELFVKMSRPGYFFLVGHVDKKGERFSYLVDFYTTPGNRKFVRRVDADEVNRWISIGEFDIVPPYGLETFQMIATVKDPVDAIPANVFDPESELYIISKDITKGVAATRALKKKKESIDAVAEDVLVFSTTEK
jgi:hypothetical protein